MSFLARACRWIVVVCVVAASGCGAHDDHDHSDHHHGMPSGATCPSTQTLSYESFGRAFMQSYCLRCHSSTVDGPKRKGAPSDHDFDELLAIRAMADHIDGYAASGPAATNAAMPPDAPKPTTEERRQLGEWLACGAP